MEAGLSLSLVYQIEAGLVHQPTPATRNRLAAALKTHHDKLWGKA